MKEQFYILILLFIYRLFWGYFLYKFIKSAVVPLLLRYPDADAGGSGIGRLLYYIEGQSSLRTEPAVQHWLWLLLALTLLRLLLTPFIRAGLLHELHQERAGARGLFFFPGMKKYGLPVLVFSLVEWALTLLPLYWLLPRMYRLLLGGILEVPLLLKLVPYVLGWLLYLFLIRKLLLYMQFGYTAGTGMFSSLLICLKVLLPSIGVSVILGAGSLIILILCSASALLYPGLPALLLRQAAPLPSTLFNMWGVAAQYHLWSSKSFPQ
ncbi:hypothetical protein HQN87_31110 [Paenibacillus tritici]|uniref:Uncharacterized protein n=1 Tax=Paenibacillus tritici TaxID=1873425 RepID=A0ABX2E119_9BACL|nr:hypothetical protein [Paenibacillus tritici]NQX49754.1 hypothetical protein [Paenibacillus tritici]QUL55127.1 hypothetical protein KDC22_00500 [Paenibacillus tritici]